MVDPLLIAVIGTVVGAGLNTIRGYLNSQVPYSAKKLAGALIPSIIAGVALGQTMTVTGLGSLAILLIGLTSGFAVDYAVTKAKTG